MKSGPEKASKVGLSIALGAGNGSALGVAFGDIAIGLALGTSLGIAIGITLDSRKADDDPNNPQRMPITNTFVSG